jgi:hypothetical protein
MYVFVLSLNLQNSFIYFDINFNFNSLKLVPLETEKLCMRNFEMAITNQMREI